MDEPNYWWQTAVSLAVAGVGFLVHRSIKTVDGHEERIKKLEQESITEADLDKTIRRFEDTLSDTQGKVTEIWKFLAEKK